MNFYTVAEKIEKLLGMAFTIAKIYAVTALGTLAFCGCRLIVDVASAAPNATRLIVFTDEESQDPVGSPHCKGYMVNVATSKNGVGYGPWTCISGFSENVVQYIAELERVEP